MSALPFRLRRILRHSLFDERDARRALGAEGLARLQQRVAASERGHSGEIRVCIEAGLPLAELWRGVTARQRAVALFGELRVWDTEHNNGVLIYLLLAERRIELLADRGLTRHVPPARWQEVMDGMQAAFQAGEFERGLNQAIDAVDALLLRHFPLAAGEANPNELPDAPAVR